MNIKLQNHCFKVFLFTCLAISVTSWASVFAPGWRGADKTVYVEWDTWTYRTTYPGDLIFTPDLTGFGAGTRKSFAPQAVQLAAPVTGGAAEILSTYNNRPGVLKLNTEGLYVNLPNFLPGEQYTRLRFEICYDDTYASFADFQVWGLTDTGAIPGYDGVYINPLLVKNSRDGAWVTEVYEFVIKPSPQWETVFIRFDHYPTSPQDLDAPYIDYLSVDTLCAPEPASLLLLALGTVFLRKSGR
jgi:hypothetical protein